MMRKIIRTFPRHTMTLDGHKIGDIVEILPLA